MILPDHPTPISLRTHTGDPVPFLIYDHTRPACGVAHFNEQTARQKQYRVERGHDLMALLVGKS